MYGQDILCGISKVTFEIPHKISYPYIERCAVCWEVKFQELPGSQARKCFWNAHTCFLQFGICWWNMNKLSGSSVSFRSKKNIWLFHVMKDGNCAWENKNNFWNDRQLESGLHAEIICLLMIERETGQHLSGAMASWLVLTHGWQIIIAGIFYTTNILDPSGKVY